MKKLLIKCHGQPCGHLEELEGNRYRFCYLTNYHGPAVSLTMPVREACYEYDRFPPYFDGLLPEGIQLEGLLRIHKIDQNDYMTQLLYVGGDLVGAVTVEEASS